MTSRLKRIMARKTVKLAWITNRSLRNSTLRKRKKGLMKKARELATLCGIKVCVIVFEPEEQQPDVWPSAPEAAETLALLKSLPEMCQSKKMMDREGFLRQRLSKQAEQVRRVERENGELETELLMNQCLAGRSLEDASAADLGRLSWMLDMKLKLIQNRLERAYPAVGVDAGLTAATPSTQAEARGVRVAPVQTPMEELQGQNWLNMLSKTEPGTCGYNFLTEPTTRGKAAQEPPPAAMDHRSLLMLQCPSKATEVFKTHEYWPLMDQTTKEKGPSFGGAMQALQSQSWNAGAAVDVPCQSMAFDDGGEGAVAPTGWSLYDHLLYDPSFFPMI